MTTKAKTTLINSERKTIIIIKTGKLLTQDENKKSQTTT